MAIKLKPEFVLQADSGDKISFYEFKKLFKFKSEFDYVEGNRKNRDDPLYRIFISFGLKIMILILFGRYVIDPNCPLRIFKTSFLKQIIKRVSFSNIPNIQTPIPWIWGQILPVLPVSRKKTCTVFSGCDFWVRT